VERWGGGDPNAWPECMNHCVLFIAKFSQKFDLKNMILTDTKDFSWEKWSKFAKFRKEKKRKFKLPDFYNKFQVANNIEGSWFFYKNFHIWHVARIG
jgi:hypothetical protein